MRELDFILQDFLETHYKAWSESETRAFQELLAYPDHLLFEYVMGRIRPTDHAVADVVSRIRSTVAD